MRAVGVVVIPTLDSGRCGQVWRHMDFLEAEVRYAYIYIYIYICVCVCVCVCVRV